MPVWRRAWSEPPPRGRPPLKVYRRTIEPFVRDVMPMYHLRNREQYFPHAMVLYIQVLDNAN